MAGGRPRYMPARGRRGGGFSLLGGIVVLVALGVVLWLFLRSGGAGGNATASGNGTAATQQSGSGTLTANGNDLFGIAANGDSSAFGPYENGPVHAQNVPVDSVAGDNAFFVGTGDGRMLVVPDTSAGSSVNPGDRVSFDGTLRILPIDFATRYGITDSADQQLLRRQGHYIEATRLSTNGSG